MSKITEEEKEEYHKNGIKRVKIDPDYIDYTALKEKLPEWIEKEKEGKKND